MKKSVILKPPLNDFLGVGKIGGTEELLVAMDKAIRKAGVGGATVFSRVFVS